MQRPRTREKDHIKNLSCLCVRMKYQTKNLEVRWCDDFKERMERAIEMQRMLIERKKYENFFHEGDLVYLDGASPEEEEVNGINANYRMLPPRNQNLCITIYCARIVNKNG